MAATLGETFRFDLTCTVCRELFREPKTLTCLHTFCEECLREHKNKRPLDLDNGDTRERLPCPNCREVQPSADVSEIRTNPTFKNMVSHLALKDKITSSKGQAKCGDCVEKPDAVAICKDCNKPLCEYCKEAHSRRADTATHGVILLSELRRARALSIPREANSVTESTAPRAGRGGQAVPTGRPRPAEEQSPGFDGMKQIPWRCEEHPGEKVEVYCEDCDEVVCFRCAVLKHRNEDGQMHKHRSASEVVDSYMAKVLDAVHQVEAIEKKFDEAIRLLCKLQSSLDEAEKCEKDKIRKQRLRLQKQLEDQEKALVEKVEEIAKRKKAQLDTQLEELRGIKEDKLHISAKVAKGVCEVGIPVEVLAVWSQLHERLTTVRDDYIRHHLEPIDNDIIQFEKNVESEQNITESNAIGQVTSDSHPESFTVDDLEARHFVQGKVEELTVTCRDIVGTKLLDRFQTVHAELRQVREQRDGGEEEGGGEGGGGVAVECEVGNNRDGAYKVTVHPRTYGPHVLTISVMRHNQPHLIKGSPFHFYVAPPHCEVNAHLHAICAGDAGQEGMNPWGIAVTEDRALVVSDIKNHRVLVFSNERRLVKAVGKKGQGQVEFNSPRGIAISLAGNFIVAEKENHRLQEVTLDGGFVRYFGQNEVGKAGGDRGKFASPSGVAVNRHGIVFATDSLNQRVQFFQPDGACLGVIGKWGRGPNAFNDPYGICIYEQLQSLGEEGHEMMYVTSRAGDQVQCLEKHQDDQYDCIRIFDETTGQLQKPVGVAVEPKSGYVFVVELAKHCVSILTRNGKVIYSFGRQGSGDGQFENPMNVAVLNDSCIAVTDCGNGRVLIFHILQVEV